MTSRLVPAPGLARIAVVFMTGASLLAAYLDVTWVHQVDPMHDPVSDYVFHNGALFVLTVLQLMLGGLAVAAGMRSVGMPRDRGVSILFGLWAAGLAVVAVFPGNRTVTDSSVSGDIHRFGGAVFLTCLPLACWRLAKTLSLHPVWILAARRIRGFAVASLLTAAAFGVAQFVSWLPQGLLERFALGAEIALVVVLALIIRRAAR